MEAYARIRPLAILDATIQGQKLEPGPTDLRRRADELAKEVDWAEIFPGVSSITLNAEGEGPNISLRLTKKEGLPVLLVPEGRPGASVVGVKRVTEQDYYSLSRDQLAKHLGLTGPQTTAAIRYLELKDDGEYFKEFRFGKLGVPRYSQKALDRIKEELDSRSIEEIWDQVGWGRNKQVA